MAHFKTELLNHPEGESIAWGYYQVRADETLNSVAKKHHISEERLASVNHLEDSAIKAGWGLLVPLHIAQKINYYPLLRKKGSEKQRRSISPTLPTTMKHVSLRQIVYKPL